ncbi:hypothetical protein PIB30_020307 [Stylosanthes scabra]|uniref:Uncharacterized protein n=1 Tax=Stylosanthes scabra TaxID=79078 RepID=A0ABU6W6I8_9FABA|nr:hypothetical protein [Stylosanthes scabra]
MASPEVLMTFFMKADFGQAVMLTNFHFDLMLLLAFVKRLRIYGDSFGGAMRDFETHCRHLTWGWVEELLGVRPPPNPQARNESFSLKMTWLRKRMHHIPTDADVDTLRQYASSLGCDHVSICMEVIRHALAEQGSSGWEASCMPFQWTPYGSDDLRFLSSELIRYSPEIRTWWSLVSIMCFNLVHMHHVNQVMRQLGADQSIPIDPVNVDAFMTSIGRGKYVWWLHTPGLGMIVGCATRQTRLSLMWCRSQISMARGTARVFRPVR